MIDESVSTSNQPFFIVLSEHEQIVEENKTKTKINHLRHFNLFNREKNSDFAYSIVDNDFSAVKKIISLK